MTGKLIPAIIVVVVLAIAIIGISTFLHKTPADERQTKPENQLFESSKALPQNQQNSFPTQNPQNSFPNQNQDFSRSTGKSCAHNAQPIFTNYFIDLDKLEHVTPIGGIKVGSQSRSYVFTKQDNGFHAPIYAPINSTITQIIYAQRSQLGRAEYRLNFEVSCEVSYAFDHLSDISDKLKEFAPKVPATTTAYNDGRISIPISAGELVGYTGGREDRSLDFIVFNYAKLVPHINPARWTFEDNLYADCPYDYFKDGIKEQYYAKIASASGFIPEKKICRSASRDVLGALSGAWFQGKATDMSGPHLLIASDFTMVDLVTQGWAGKGINFDNNIDYNFGIRDMNPKADPDNVKIGDSVCYSDGNYFAYFKVISDAKMEAAIASGACPSSAPTEGYEIWER